MAVNFEELDKIEREEGGSGLRRKLEDALRQNAELTGKVALYEAGQLISEKGYTLVKPEDLSGVKPNELEAKAEALQQQREGERKSLVREMLAKKGYADAELDLAVDEWFAGEGFEADGSDFAEITEADSLGGRPVKRISPEQMSPLEKLEAGLSKGKRR